MAMAMWCDSLRMRVPFGEPQACRSARFWTPVSGKKSRTRARNGVAGNIFCLIGQRLPSPRLRERERPFHPYIRRPGRPHAAGDSQLSRPA